MWRVIRRIILPALLLIGGVSSLIYGVAFHTIPIVEEKETQTTISVPAESTMHGPPGASEFGGPPGMPGGTPFVPPPPMVPKTVTRIDRNVVVCGEPVVIRDVTVGGVMLVESGAIKRTYDSSSGKGPALCPT